MSLLRELHRRNVIRVATAYVVSAWLIIQVVETIFPAFGFTDKAMRMVVIVLSIGFIPAVIGAWIFEVTPEGLKRDADIAKSGPRDTRSFDRAIVVVLALGLAYFAVDKFLLAPERAAVREAEVAEQAKAEALTGFYGDRSIAVLPFENMSADPEQVYFVDGVAEEILNLLAGIRDLRVISRSSSFTFRDQDRNIPDIAKQLNVAHVLEGSVRKAGNRVRVTAQLIEARTDRHLWAKTYERELEDVFMIEDEIALDVVRNLKFQLPEFVPHSRQIDPEVRALTQQARRINEERRGLVGEEMRVLLERALELDPEYVPALELMSLAEWFRWTEGLITDQELRDRKEFINARIRVLDPENGFIEAGEAWDLMLAGHYEDAAKKYLVSLEKDLSEPTAVRGAAYLAQRLGKTDISVKLLEHGMAVDPLCLQCLKNLSRSLLFGGDYAGAIGIRERYMASAGEGDEDYALMLLMAGQAERVADLLPLDVDHGLGDLSDLLYSAMAAHSLGHSAEAERIYADLEARLVEDMAAEVEFFRVVNVQYKVAGAAAWMGKTDRAFELLMPLAGTPFNFPRRDLFSPMWTEIRDDPRWLEYRTAQGLSPERVDAIEFDPWLPE